VISKQGSTFFGIGADAYKLANQDSLSASVDQMIEGIADMTSNSKRATRMKISSSRRGKIFTRILKLFNVLVASSPFDMREMQRDILFL
jgi:hypothetical protein